jgi:RimJ/RimL family protein N-acetyltransferase
MDVLGVRGERIRLTPPDRERHMVNAWRWINDPGVTLTLNRYFGATLGQEAEWFDRIEKGFGRDDFVWAILTDEDRHIGFTGLHAIDWKDRCALGGIVIGEREAWGKGYGTDVIRTRSRFAFEQIGLHRVEGRTFEFNRAMQRIYERCGYRQEGVQRKRIWRNGRWWDMLLYAILAEEYYGERQP